MVGEKPAHSRGDRPLSIPRDRQQEAVVVICGGRLSYVCIYKSDFFPRNISLHINVCLPHDTEI